MNIALMSGAYVNAGDFLIERRCRELLETNIANTHVDILKRNVAYDNQLDKLNSYDLIVFGGGPIFQRALYPDKIPFVKDLRAVTAPCAILGGGWKGCDCKEKNIYRSKYFTPSMLHFVEYVAGRGISIGCRDWYTVRMLKEQGIHNAVMTGCPAWYDMRTIGNLSFRGRGDINKEKPYIALSDAAYTRNIKYMKIILEVVRGFFPSARIKVILHRGITKQNRWMLEENYKALLNYEVEDISGSDEGFRVYDMCDLHIGFRVHAHIYNLSIGNASILINEDARGAGVNEALGIRNVFINQYLKQQLYDYLDFLNETNMRQYVCACDNLKFYYTIMQKYIADTISLSF